MSRGIRRVRPDATIDLCPIADGGEGTVDALAAATGGEIRTSEVVGPLGSSVTAQWAMLGQAAAEGGGDIAPTAVIEMAAASGLALVASGQRDPMSAGTFGTGQLIAAALDAGAGRIIVGIGGSATNDGGCGMAAALGVMFVDHQGRGMVDPPPTGAMLERVGRIDISGLDQRIGRTRITVACDVTNPLTGPNGAAHVYGPQKGATSQQVEQLDRGLRHLAGLWREQLGQCVEQLPGAGAAGGLGGGLIVFLGARLERGIEVVLDAVGFERRVVGCDLCLTGEGRLDGQSVAGKACIGVAQAAGRHGVHTIGLVGSLGPGVERTLGAGLGGYHCIGAGLSVDESMRRADKLIEQAAADVVGRLGVCG